jgi:uncharacterized protein YraI
MASSDLFDAFDDCIACLNAGQSVDDCLRAYPQYAAALRPMLETGLAVRRAAPAVPAGARNRVRARVMRRRAPRWRPYRIRSAAAVLLVSVVAVVLIALWLNQDNDRLRIKTIPTVEQTPPSATPSQTPTPSHTPTETASPSPTATETADAPTPAAAPTYVQSITATPTPAPECRFKVTVSSVNMRSGPGTGYNVLGFAYSGEEFVVLAQHASADWLEIAANGSRAWIATSVGELSSDCAVLPVSDMPVVTGGGPSDDGNFGPGGSNNGPSDDAGGNGSGSSGGDNSGGSGGAVSDDNGGGHKDDKDEPKDDSDSPEPPDDS